MRKALIAVAALIVACTSSARAQTTYKWTPLANGHNVDGRGDSRHRTLANTAPFPAKVSAINITSSRLVAAGMVDYDYTVDSGFPSPIVGEYAEVAEGVPTGMFKVLSLQTDPANGSLQMTVAENTDDAYPNSGPANVGPAFSYSLAFNGPLSDDYAHLLPGASCIPGQSSVLAYFLDANGNLQSVASDSNGVTCGPNTTTGTIYTGITQYTSGSFIGMGTDGNQYKINFTLVNKANTRTAAISAQSLTWTIGAQSSKVLYNGYLISRLNACTNDGKVWWNMRADGMCYAKDSPRRK